MADETEIKAGDVVTLKSGSRPFTVSGFFKPEPPTTGTGQTYVELVWDAGHSGIRHERVTLHSLVKA